jgi:hypothetical protein
MNRNNLTMNTATLLSGWFFKSVAVSAPLSTALLYQARTLDERLTRLLDDMEARMPRKNPAFDPKAKRLMNRRTTQDLAIKERVAHAAHIKAAGHSRQLKVLMMDIACWLRAKRYFHKGPQMLRCCHKE